MRLRGRKRRDAHLGGHEIIVDVLGEGLSDGLAGTVGAHPRDVVLTAQNSVHKEWRR